MSTLLVFREGCCGRFVQAVVEESNADVGYRMPDHASQKLFATHVVDVDSHCQQFDLVLRILPDKNIYNAIYNNFSKKLMLENFSDFELKDYVRNPTYWYDICFYNIDEYFKLHLQDKQANKYKNLINFDKLLDKDYFAEILETYFDYKITKKQINIIEKYADLQLKIDLCHDNVVDMKEIIEPIPDHLFASSPWFFSYCIFKYENNNGLTEDQRTWSINLLTHIQKKSDLIDLAKKYA
jgi:hypothetical protein